MKSNPAMVTQMMKTIPGGDKMDEAAFVKQIDQLASMDEDQLKTFLK